MKKLRKMLGALDSPEIIELMKTIDSQDLQTVSMWALESIKEIPGLDSLKEVCVNVLEGKVPKASLKEALKKENAKVKELEFLDEIAARAIITATGVYLSPTKSLGYVFYYASYKTYQALGFEDTRENYDAYASKVIQDLLVKLKAVCKDDVEKPLNVKWGC